MKAAKMINTMKLSRIRAPKRTQKPIYSTATAVGSAVLGSVGGAIGSGVATRAVPHLTQKRASATFSFPQIGQVRAHNSISAALWRGYMGLVGL